MNAFTNEDGGFRDAQKNISASLIAATRSTAHIAAEDVGFHRSSDPLVYHSIRKHSSRLFKLSQKLLLQSYTTNDLVEPQLQNLDATDANWKAVVDTLDHLLERADIALDEYAGYFRKRKDDSRDSSPAPKRSKYLPKEFRTQVITKPQLSFLHKPLNHETTPFKPLLSAKPHAHVELDDSIEITSDGGFSHPYQHEIEEYQYPQWVSEKSSPIDPRPFKSTQAIFVDDIGAVYTMLKELRLAKEIAIDLEHHDTHSYIGMVSLMQISTRDQDWIIDTLRPWRRDLEVLNQVFADPEILKVLHGAHMDVMWLQRDFGLYLVGLFDTYHASKTLRYSGHSLAYLLKKFVDFDAQKQYQTADWRIRPLPVELFNYARSDTHFLLYIYDNMRNELLEKSSHNGRDELQNVLHASKEYALQRYENPSYCEMPSKGHNGWFAQLLKWPAHLNDAQLTAYRKLYEWRDHVGREEDESTNYIMSNLVLQNIVHVFPTNEADLFSAIGTPSHICRARRTELIAIMLKSHQNSTTGAAIRRDLEAIQTARDTSHIGFHKNRLPTHGTSVTLSAKTLRTVTTQFWGSETMSHIPDMPSIPLDPYGLLLANDLQEASSQVNLRGSKVLNGREKHEDLDFEEHSNFAALKKREHIAAQAHPIISLQKEAQPSPSRIVVKKNSQLRAQAQQASSEESLETVFDYVNSPSVTKKQLKQGSRNKESLAREHFNPFAKAAEAQDGLGRAQSLRSGRTATFKEGSSQREKRL